MPDRVSDSWSGWRNHRSPSYEENYRADDGEVMQCRAFYGNYSEDITEHTLDGTAFH
jgi:hypothetical protein